MWLRILLFTLMLVRTRILPFSLMWIRIQVLLFTLMRIRILLFTFDADPDPTTHFSPDLYPPVLQNDPLMTHLFTLMRIRILLLLWCGCWSGSRFSLWCVSGSSFTKWCGSDPQHCNNVSSPFRSSRTYKYIWMFLPPSPPPLKSYVGLLLQMRKRWRGIKSSSSKSSQVERCPPCTSLIPTEQKPRTNRGHTHDIASTATLFLLRS